MKEYDVNCDDGIVLAARFPLAGNLFAREPHELSIKQAGKEQLL